MYALSLVLWEVCRRTVTNEVVDEYQPPFYDAVGPDPSFEEMKEVVCDRKLRPIIPSRWLENQVSQFFFYYASIRSFSLGTPFWYGYLILVALSLSSLRTTMHV